MKETEKKECELVEGKYIRRNIEFNAEGTILRGWFYLPNTNELRFPTIIMAHGFGSLKEMHLDRFAQTFAVNGFASILFDYSNFGDSDGQPRGEINPWRQIEEYKHAITFATTLAEVDTEKIGVWGTSYSGGHVLVVGASDHRVKCVVSQVPTISGSESSLRRVPAEKVETLYEEFRQDRVNRMLGKQPIKRTLVSNNIEDNPVYGTAEALEWYLTSGEKSPNWTNEVTLRSIEYSRTYNPGTFISLVSPKPLLLLVGTDDKVTPTDLALKAYEKALEPKKLVLIQGGHFDPYIKKFDIASKEAIEWFSEHLQ